MFSSEEFLESGQNQGSQAHASPARARSWLYRLTEQSGFGQLEERQAPIDSRLPPDFDQRVRQVGEW